MQVEISDVHIRHSHSATAFSFGPGLMEVTVFGGSMVMSSVMTSTVVLRFGMPTIGYILIALCLALGLFTLYRFSFSNCLLFTYVETRKMHKIVS